MGGWVVQTPTVCSMVSANLWQGMGGGCKALPCTAADANLSAARGWLQEHRMHCSRCTPPQFCSSPADAQPLETTLELGPRGVEDSGNPRMGNPLGHPQSKMGHLGGIWGFRIGRTEKRRAEGWDEAVLTPRTARSHQHIPKLCSHRSHLWGHGTRKRCHSSLIPAQGTARAFGSGAQKAHIGGLGRLSTSTAFAREQSAGK